MRSCCVATLLLYDPPYLLFPLSPYACAPNPPPCRWQVLALVREWANIDISSGSEVVKLRDLKQVTTTHHPTPTTHHPPPTHYTSHTTFHLPLPPTLYHLPPPSSLFRLPLQAATLLLPREAWHEDWHGSDVIGAYYRSVADDQGKLLLFK